ncbi:putative leader peptide [Streptomyces purpurogeneiscleroticus]
MSSSALLTTRGHIDLLRVASAACRRGCYCCHCC